MVDTATSTIGANVRELRDALGLSQDDFALLVNISRATLVSIEAGKDTFRFKSLEGILAFTTLKIEDLSKRNFNPPKTLRDRLIKKYKNIPSIHVILSQEPTIAYGIKYKLLHSSFLDEPKETREIKRFFEGKGWYFKGNSLHTALKRMQDYIAIEPHPTKKGTNVYSRKR